MITNGVVVGLYLKNIPDVIPDVPLVPEVPDVPSTPDVPDVPEEPSPPDAPFKFIIYELPEGEFEIDVNRDGKKVCARKKDLIDEIVIYLAPSLIGQGRAIFDEMIHPVLNRTYNISSVELVGRDLRIRVSLR